MLVSGIIRCIVIQAKPKFGDGKFKVEYTDRTALLSWPKPSGDFSRQAVQKTPGITKKNQQCEGECVEEEVWLNQTSHTTYIEPGRQYRFRLVLYDGDVLVQSLENPEITGSNLSPLLSPFTTVHNNINKGTAFCLLRGSEKALKKQ